MYTFHREQDLFPCWQVNALPVLQWPLPPAPLPIQTLPRPVPIPIPTPPQTRPITFAALFDEHHTSDEPDEVEDSEEAELPVALQFRRSLWMPKGTYTPILDTVILAALLGQGIRLIREPPQLISFDIFDFVQYFQFTWNLPGFRERHKDVGVLGRVKALQLWFDGPLRKLISDTDASCRIEVLSERQERLTERLIAMRSHLRKCTRVN